MPGGGGGAQSAANMPPGMQPPPGLDSGGARTLMGTTIIPPDNSVLLVKYSYADAPSSAAPEWQSCRRIIPIENCLLVEGVNYDKRAEEAEQDVNQVLPLAGLTGFQWKYEPKPAPPPEKKKAEEKPGKK
jgi:hypothetical protein